jgi:hypothetical protein
VRARRVLWEHLAYLKDTRQKFPSAHRETRRARFPMRDPNLPLWRWSCSGPLGGPGFSLSLELHRKPDLAGIARRRVACCSLFAFQPCVFRYHAESLRQPVEFFVTSVGYFEAALYCDCSFRSWDFEHEICVVRYCHELCKCWAPQDCMIL